MRPAQSRPREQARSDCGNFQRFPYVDRPDVSSRTAAVAESLSRCGDIPLETLNARSQIRCTQIGKGLFGKKLAFWRRKTLSRALARFDFRNRERTT